MTLFDDILGDLDLEFRGTSASLAACSECGRYLYALGRRWDLRAVCGWLLLHPRTATEDKDDAIVRKCSAYAKTWGFGGIVIVNLFALRTKSISGLLNVDGVAVGSRNDAVIRRVVGEIPTVVAGWGKVPPALRYRVADVERYRSLECLGHNSDGTPKHPIFGNYDDVRIPLHSRGRAA